MTSKQLIEMFVNFHDYLFNDRDFLFESQCQYDFDFENEIYTHVVDVNLSRILMRNTINLSIILTRRIKLDTIIEYNQTSCYLIMSNNVDKIVNDWMTNRSWKKKLTIDFVDVTTTFVVTISIFEINTLDTNANFSIISSITNFETTFASSIISQIDINLKYMLSNDVTIYDNDVNVVELIVVVNEYQNIFVDVDIIVNISKTK